MSFLHFKSMGAVKINEYIYASNLDYNGLFKIDSTSGRREFLGYFPEESIDLTDMHRIAFLYKGKIFFIPYNARNMHLYDIQKKEFTMI